MKLAYVFALSALVFCTHAQAINKCTAADGSILYQDEPCPGGGRASELKIQSPPPEVSSPQAGRYSGGSGVVHTGPRGGRYTITKSGNKNYLPRR